MGVCRAQDETGARVVFAMLVWSVKEICRGGVVAGRSRSMTSRASHEKRGAGLGMRSGGRWLGSGAVRWCAEQSESEEL